MVPNGWEVKLLGSLTNKIGSGKTPKGGSSTYQSYGIPLIRSQNVLWGSLDLSDVAYIDEEQHQSMKNSSVFEFDVLLNITGASIGRVAISTLKEANVNQHVCIIRPKKILDNNFLKYNLLSFEGQKQIDRFQAGGNRQGLNFEQIKSFKIMLPPLPEQRKIAKILTTWDKAINTTERLIENSKQQKKSLMQQLLTGQKRLLDDSGQRFSGDWEEIKLGQVSDMNSGGTPKSTVKKYYGGNIPWVSIADMTTYGKWISKTTKYLTDEGIANSSARLYPKGTVLYAMYASIGECSIAEVPLSSSQAILGIRPKSDLNNIYLYYYLKSIQNKVVLMGQQGTQSNLNAGMVKNFKLSLPTIFEQQKIASVLTTADKDIEVLEQQLADLQREKKALMQQLLTGKKRVVVD